MSYQCFCGNPIVPKDLLKGETFIPFYCDECRRAKALHGDPLLRPDPAKIERWSMPEPKVIEHEPDESEK